MRRATRARRLSIAAIVSLLLFVAVAIVSVRSFWIVDELHFKHWQLIQTDSGSIAYHHWHGRAIAPAEVGFWWHNTNQKTLWRTYGVPRPWDFNVQDFQTFPEQPGLWAMLTIEVPLWIPLLFLLIAPVLRLIARRTNAPGHHRAPTSLTEQHITAGGPPYEADLLIGVDHDAVICGHRL